MTIQQAADALSGDYSSATLALVFGRRTRDLIRDGKDPYVAARLAGSFAGKVIAERPKVIGTITPQAPWGIS